MNNNEDPRVAYDNTTRVCEMGLSPNQLVYFFLYDDPSPHCDTTHIKIMIIKIEQRVVINVNHESMGYILVHDESCTLCTRGKR